MVGSQTEVLTPERRAALLQLAARHGVNNLRVFGSYARGQAGPDSDLDLLVDIEYGRGVARRFLRFCREADDLLGLHVDVVTADGLDERLHAGIFREAQPL